MALARTSLVRLIPQELLTTDAKLGLQFRAVERGEALRRALVLLLGSKAGPEEKLARILKLLDESEGEVAVEERAAFDRPAPKPIVVESKQERPPMDETKEMKWLHLPRCDVVKRALE